MGNVKLTDPVGVVGLAPATVSMTVAVQFDWWFTSINAGEQFRVVLVGCAWAGTCNVMVNATLLLLE